MKDRLTPKNSGRAQASMQINPPPVRVKMPEIKVPAINIPEIKIPEVKVSADMQPIASAIQAIGGAVAELGRQQTLIAEQQTALLEVIKTLATQSGSKAKTPKAYQVDFDREGGQTVGMRVKVG